VGLFNQNSIIPRDFAPAVLLWEINRQRSAAPNGNCLPAILRARARARVQLATLFKSIRANV
jgi:hypothetical protein